MTEPRCQHTRIVSFTQRALVLISLLSGLLASAMSVVLAESQWYVPDQSPQQQGTGTVSQTEPPKSLPSDQSSPSQSSESEVNERLPKGQTSGQVRAMLDARLKAALQHACPADARPIGLQDIAARHQSTESREKAILAFWRVARTAIVVDIVTEALSELEKLQVTTGDHVILDSFKQLYTARLYELRGDLQAGLVSLTYAVGEDDGRQLLFPDDIFHTGGYSTRLEKLYPGTAPLALRRLDEMIPLARQSIYLHFGASQSARDAWLAFKEAYEMQRVHLWDALACWRLWLEEQVRCTETIETYNRLILEYVLATGNGHLPAESFVKMLVEENACRVISSQRSSASTTGPSKSSAARAGEKPILQVMNSQPLATFAKHVALSGIESNDDRNSKFLLLPGTMSKQQWFLPVSMSSANDGWIQAGLSTPYFGALRQNSAGVFVQQLAEMSFKMGNAAAGGETRRNSVSLAGQMLRARDREKRVRLYWDVAVVQAKYAILLQYSAALSEVFPVVLARWNEPGMAEEMLRLQAYRRTGDAALQDIHLEMVEKAFTLLEATPNSNGIQAVATTLPYAGEYDTKWTEVKTQLPYSAQPVVSRVVCQIPSTYAALCQKGLALLAADQSRILDAGQFAGGQQPLGSFLNAIHLECETWQEFVELVGRYNQFIADYVCLVRPDLDENAFLRAIGISRN